MDFKLIRTKLSDGVYKGMDEFVRDMNLVFDNCIKYNGDQNPVAKIAVEVRDIFKNAMRLAGYQIWFVFLNFYQINTINYS